MYLKKVFVIVILLVANVSGQCHDLINELQPKIEKENSSLIISKYYFLALNKIIPDITLLFVLKYLQIGQISGMQSNGCQNLATFKMYPLSYGELLVIKNKFRTLNNQVISTTLNDVTNSTLIISNTIPVYHMIRMNQ